jgi:hypothetical protein
MRRPDTAWPADLGDDPAPIAAVESEVGLITWGVCRRSLRNIVTTGDVVVFFAADRLPEFLICGRGGQTTASFEAALASGALLLALESGDDDTVQLIKDRADHWRMLRWSLSALSAEFRGKVTILASGLA